MIAVLLAPVQGRASGGVPVVTTISDVKSARAEGSDSTGLLTFTAAHDFTGSVAPGERLGGARIDRADHPEAFAGTWAHGGHVGGWVAPPTEDPKRSYHPAPTLIDNVYFENSLISDAPATVAGDHAEFGMGVVPMDAPLPWTRPRSVGGGRLGWDGSITMQETTSTFGDESADVDVVMFRADVVARGGDVDARSEPIELEPLVLDLPRAYEGVPNFVGITVLSTPYLNYLTDFSAVPLWSAGKLVLRGEISGYVPEARRYTLPNGAVIKEWHIPLVGVIAFDRSHSDLVPVAAASMPQGGLALITDALGQRAVPVPPGEALQVAPGDSQEPAAGSEPESTGEPDSASGEGVVEPTAPGVLEPERDELETAALVGRTMTGPVEIDLPTSGFTATLDPDFDDSGLIALRDVRSTLLRKSYAEAVTVPAVVVDGSIVPLERSRLVDLRALPFRDGGGVGVGLTARFDDLNQSVWNAKRIYRSGLFVHAVYDLGDGLHAFVEHQMFHGGVPPGGRVNTKVVVQSLDARPIHAFPIQYVELTEPGPAILSETQRDNEFSATVFATLAVGEHRTSSDYRAANRIVGGKMTVLRAPSPLLGRAPDPEQSIVGHKVVLIHEPPPTITADTSTLTTFRVGLANGMPRDPVIPPPLGESCGGIAVAETVPDAPPRADVREAWFDADLANLYVSLRLAEVPTTALSPTGDRYQVNWRLDHEGYGARATLSATGTWTFELGLFVFGSFVRAGALTGDVEPGPDGVVRMRVPRGWLDLEDGAILRDTGAHVSVGTTNFTSDRAPNGSSSAFGLGDDHVVETCPVSIPPVLETLLTFTSDTPRSVAYGDEATLVLSLVDEGGAPVADAPLSVVIEGDTARREWVAQTDDEGFARLVIDVVERPASYEVIATYEGADGSYLPSTATWTLEVVRAASGLDLVVDGRGAHRILSAALTAPDGSPLAGRAIDFYADSELIGSAVTDEEGNAVLQAPPRYRGGKHTFEARFGGDDYYLGSSDGEQT